MWFRSLLLTLGILLQTSLTLAGPITTVPGDDNWSAEFCRPGPRCNPGAITTDNDQLYAGPNRFDGALWHTLCTDPPHACPYFIAMVIFDGQPVGLQEVWSGSYQYLVQSWDGQQWQQLGDSYPGDPPLDLAVFRDELYAGQYRWTGSEWELGVAISGQVTSCLVQDDQLYLTEWSTAWKFDGVELAELAGLNGYLVKEMTFYRDQPLVLASTGSAFELLSWNGVQWQVFATSAEIGLPVTMLGLGDYLYVVLSSAPDNIPRLIRWDGSDWIHVIDTGHGRIDFLGSYGDHLVLTGTFVALQDFSAQTVCLLTDSGLQPVHQPGKGMYQGSVAQLVHYQSKLLATGGFTMAGAEVALGTALFDGESWTALLDWTDPATAWELPMVTAAVHEDILYGSFLDVTAVFEVDRWRPIDSWTPYRMVSFQGSLYGTASDSLMVLQGELWQDTGSRFVGIDDELPWVRDMFVLDDALYFGGEFAGVDEVEALNIVRWDGEAWQTLSSGLEGSVFALCSHQGQLYAGGFFIDLDGLPFSGLAYWDGITWSAIMNPTAEIFIVQALASHAGRLYIAGQEQVPGKSTIPYIGSWDGNAWQSLGSGVNNYVDCLASYQDRLYVGGSFDEAGGKSSDKIAVWDETNVPVWLTSLTVKRCAGGACLSWHTATSSPGASFQIWQIANETDAMPVGRPLDAGHNQFDFTDVAAPATRCDYRLELIRAEDSLWFGPVRLEPLPMSLNLESNFPNPFNPSTTLRFSIPAPSHARLTIYDAGGRRIVRLVDENLPAGQYERVWNGYDERGAPVASGLYLARLELPQGSDSVKLMLAR